MGNEARFDYAVGSCRIIFGIQTSKLDAAGYLEDYKTEYGTIGID
ncbi:MAG: hypothetical protein ACXWIP_17570 [Burkholderiales bacterium]